MSKQEGMDVKRDEYGNYQRCPHCEKTGFVDYDEVGWNGDGTLTLLCYCTCCGAQWDDVYTFVRRENIKENPEE